jgi:hypothetical protein
MNGKFWVSSTNMEIFKLWIHARISLFRRDCSCQDMLTIENYKSVLGHLGESWIPNRYDPYYSIFVTELCAAIEI